LVDLAPGGESAQVAVVNVKVRIDLSALLGVPFLFGKVFVHGIKLKTVFSAILHCLAEKLTAAVGPKDQPEAFFLKAFQGIKGKGPFAADFRVTVLDNGTVEVNGKD
jgi:hypothetical protein